MKTTQKQGIVWIGYIPTPSSITWTCMDTLLNCEFENVQSRSFEHLKMFLFAYFEGK